MEVRLYATLRQIAGSRSVVLDPSGDTVRDALDDLIGLHPGLSERILDTNGGTRQYVAIMVNGRDIRHLNGLDTLVSNDSELDIFPPVAGGAVAGGAVAGGAVARGGR